MLHRAAHMGNLLRSAASRHSHGEQAQNDALANDAMIHGILAYQLGYKYGALRIRVRLEALGAEVNWVS
jgi:hypothetical protein